MPEQQRILSAVSHLEETMSSRLSASEAKLDQLYLILAGDPVDETATPGLIARVRANEAAVESLQNWRTRLDDLDRVSVRQTGRSVVDKALDSFTSLVVVALLSWLVFGQPHCAQGQTPPSIEVEAEQ